MKKSLLILSVFLFLSAKALAVGIDANTVLLLHAEDQTDSSLTPKTMTVTGGLSVSSAQKKFGASSFLLNGTGYASFADSNDFDFGTGAFTIDFWVYLTETASQYALYSNLNFPGTAGVLVRLDSTEINVYINSTGSSVAVPWDGSVTGVWRHIAVVRSSNQLMIFVNGAQAGTSASSSENISGSSLSFEIGRWGALNTYYSTCYIDEYRVSKGVARWTGPFTPPTSAYSETPPDTESPSDPSNLISSSQTYSSVSLSWSASTDNTAVTGYKIIRNDTHIASSMTNSYSDTTVSPGSTYTFKVSAYDAEGNDSGQSNEITVTTPLFGGIDRNTVLMINFDGSDGSNVFTDRSTYGGSASVVWRPKPFDIFISSKAMSQLVWLPPDGLINRITTHSHDVTTIGNTTITSFSPVFGTGAGNFNNRGGFLGVEDSSDFYFGLGDFTIDFWIRFQSGAVASSALYSNRASSSGVVVQMDASSNLKVTLNSSVKTETWNPAAFTWYHVAVVRSAGELMFFVNGTQLGSPTANSDDIQSSGGANLFVGSLGGAENLSGLMDEFRVSKGVARWTSNFTPPTFPYSKKPGT